MNVSEDANDSPSEVSINAYGSKIHFGNEVTFLFLFQIHKLLPCLNVHLIRNRHEEFIELDTLYFSGFRGRRKG